VLIIAIKGLIFFKKSLNRVIKCLYYLRPLALKKDISLGIFSVVGVL
jgi:hypothetical protein